MLSQQARCRQSHLLGTRSAQQQAGVRLLRAVVAALGVEGLGKQLVGVLANSRWRQQAVVTPGLLLLVAHACHDVAGRNAQDGVCVQLGAVQDVLLAEFEEALLGGCRKEDAGGNDVERLGLRFGLLQVAQQVLQLRQVEDLGTTGHHQQLAAGLLAEAIGHGVG